MKKMKSLVLASCIALFATGCASSNSPGESANSGKEEFRFAMSGLYKPFNFSEQGQLVGFDVEIGHALAEKMDMKPVPITNPWETLIQGLLSDKYDAILGSMAITEERSKTVNFTDPYYRSGAQIFVASNNDSIQSADDLHGKRIGVLKASIFKDLALEYTDGGQIPEYDSDLTALMDLPTGRLDAVITDDIVGLRMIMEGAVDIQAVGSPLTLSEAGIAVKKENEELLDKLNQALKDIVEDGTYDEISEKWFGTSILEQN